MAPLEPIEKLTAAFAKLPGVGKRSARRMAQKVAYNRRGLADDLAAALNDVRARVAPCSLCGALTVKEEDPCRLCTDPGREAALLCVVEDPGDIALIEQAGAFRGRYHALLGKISPLRQQGPENPRFQALFERVRAEGVREVLLALNADVESDATAAYLHDMLTAEGVAVSRLASGIPVGSGIAYTDPVTLSRAIRGRQRM